MKYGKIVMSITVAYAQRVPEATPAGPIPFGEEETQEMIRDVKKGFEKDCEVLSAEIVSAEVVEI